MKNSWLKPFMLTLSLLIIFTATGSFSLLIGQSKSEITIKVKQNQSIRDVSKEYLDDPDLWEDILSANGMKSAAEVKPGTVLSIPVQAISNANRELSNSLELIQEATNQGARIFAPDIIANAIYLRNNALEKRKEGDWATCATLGKSASAEAGKALKISKSKQDVSAEAVVHYMKGNVQKRQQADNKWSEAQLKGLLTEGDRIRTLSQSYSEVLFRDESRLRLSENSQALVQKMRANLLDNTEEASISLIEGDVLALLGGGKGKKQFDLNVPGVETKINSQRFWVAKSEQEAKFANYDGEMEIAASGGKVVLKENEGSIVKQNQKPTAPRALLTFTTLESPANGKDIFHFNTFLTWKKLEDAYSYTVEIAKDNAFSDLVSKFSTRSFKNKIPPTLEGGLYHWRVTGVTADGLPGIPSKSRSFRMVNDDKPPFLVIQSPADGEIVRETPLVISGNVESGARLLVMDTEVEVAENGHFWFKYDMAVKGANTIVMKAIDPADNETILERKITFLPGDEVSLTFDPSIPMISANQFLALSKGFTLTGLTDAGSLVSVKSRTGDVKAGTYADKDGKFALNLQLAADKVDYDIKVVSLTGIVKEDHFTVQTYQDTPTFTFMEPIPFQTSQKTIRVEGEITNCVKALMNDEMLALDNGRFSETLKLNSGRNLLYLTAYNKAGDVTIFERTIIRDSAPPSFTGHSLSKYEVSGGEKVTVTVNASDETGLSKTAAFTVQAGRFEYSGVLVLSPSSGQYTGSFSVPENQRGKVKLTRVVLADYLGSKKEYKF